MQTWILTIPRRTEIQVPTWLWLAWEPVTIMSVCSKKLLNYILEQSDTKRYIIGIEKGKNGLEHFQIRLSCSDPEFFEHMKEWYPYAHIEKAESESMEYERKEGRYWTSMDTKEIHIQRFGKPNRTQQRVIDVLQRTNDREIVLWYSDKGNIGKSWILGHLWETGKAYVCQPQDTVKGMKQDIASEYIKHGWRPYVVVDLPRTWKWTKDLYCALESIKDGLIKDTRYHADTINIKGVKVLVCSNTLPKFDNLSHDRWIVIENTIQERATTPFNVTLTGVYPFRDRRNNLEGNGGIHPPSPPYKMFSAIQPHKIPRNDTAYSIISSIHPSAKSILTAQKGWVPDILPTKTGIPEVVVIVLLLVHSSKEIASDRNSGQLPTDIRVRKETVIGTGHIELTESRPIVTA